MLVHTPAIPRQRKCVGLREATFRSVGQTQHKNLSDGAARTVVPPAWKVATMWASVQTHATHRLFDGE